VGQAVENERYTCTATDLFLENTITYRLSNKL
jgi:hypothetical protein